MSMLATHLRDNEHRLMERILHYAREQGFTEYTSTLVEAWRVSIQGMSNAIIEALSRYGDTLPQFAPDMDYGQDPVAEFGIREARLHRQRGISFQMFLGLYKYYRYSYADMVREMPVDSATREHFERFVERIFDLIEIAFCSEWAGLESDSVFLELQTANRRMTNEKNKYLTLFESLNIPVFLVDNSGRIDNVNHPAANMLGIDLPPGGVYYSDRKSGGNFPLGRLLAEVLPWISSDLQGFLSDDVESHQFEKRMHPEERPFDYAVTMARMLDISGKFQGAVVTVEDVTERKAMEYQLAQTRKLESMGQLAAGVAHEINTPIQFIGNNLQFLKGAFKDLDQLLTRGASANQHDDAKGESGSTMMEEISFLRKEIPQAVTDSMEGIHRVADIVKAMRIYAHPDVSSLSLTDINEALATIVTITRNEWKQVAEVRTDFDHGLKIVEVVAGEINQAFMNIMMNAIHAISEKPIPYGTLGLIILKTRNIPGMVEITISDNGCGIPHESEHRVFDPFFTTRQVGQGTGQGLHITHTIIKKYHGSIHFDTVEGQGTSFVIRLPAPEESD